MVNGAALRPGDASRCSGGPDQHHLPDQHGGRDLEVAPVGLSVAVELTDDLDVSRGDCWHRSTTNRWSQRRSKRRSAGSVSGPQGRRALQDQAHDTLHPARLTAISSRLDVNALALEPTEHLDDNESASSTSPRDPLALDPYHHKPITGSFVLIDEATNVTVAAGMVGPPKLVEPRAQHRAERCRCASPCSRSPRDRRPGVPRGGSRPVAARKAPAPRLWSERDGGRTCIGSSMTELADRSGDAAAPCASSGATIAPAKPPTTGWSSPRRAFAT